MESTDTTLKQQEIGRLIAADKVQGTPVTSWGDEAWRRQVNDYYKVAPF